MRPKFAITGVAGFVAPRHLQAIKDVDGDLTAALDPHDAVGVLDKYDRGVNFFTSPERFERYLNTYPVDWLSVCSPNFMHDTHARLGLHSGANVICEKPLTLSPWNLDSLAASEKATGKRVFTVLQLRHMPKLIELHEKLMKQRYIDRDSVDLNYVTPRGAWYHHSWKGDEERSGGLITNIGIHMLDLLLWLWGTCDSAKIIDKSPVRMQGRLQLAHADVTFKLSISENDSPDGKAVRTLTLNGANVVLDDGAFGSLHTQVYRETLAGRGHGIADARPAVELAYKLRSTEPGESRRLR